MEEGEGSCDSGGSEMGTTWGTIGYATDRKNERIEKANRLRE